MPIRIIPLCLKGEALRMILDGCEIQQIVSELRISKASVFRIRRGLFSESSALEIKKYPPGHCKNCCRDLEVNKKLGGGINRGKRERVFCTRECEQNYDMRLRLTRCCRGCGETAPISITRGYCETCYKRLRTYCYDENLSDAAALLNKLKRMIHEETTAELRRA